MGTHNPSPRIEETTPTTSNTALEGDAVAPEQEPQFVISTNPETLPASPDISPYKNLHIRDANKLQVHLVKRAKALFDAGGNLTNVTNDLLLKNSELGNPRLTPQTVKSLASEVLRHVSKEKAVSGKTSNRTTILSAEEWINADFSGTEQQVIVGTPENPLIRPGTKNFIEAPEKAFKTTMVMRLGMGMAAGQTLFPALPITRPVKVLYLHGELSPAEIKERTVSAVQGLTVPKTFLQGRDSNAHLITKEGQKVIRDLVALYRPDVLVLDPWQSFIAGSDENSFKDMSAATKFLDTLIEEFGVTLLIPIHQGKDHSKGARGHSTLAGWRDTRIRLVPIQNNLSVRVTVEPRWATPPDPFELKFKNGTVWPDKAAWMGQTAKIREFVQDNGGLTTKTAVGEHLKVTPGALRHALKRAEEAGAITISGDEVTLPSVQ
ncbi:MAG TPA: AAA family ATPase [Candidatus Dormibacteraeota bacterium]|jgi:hypothetical protein|nr:AAA family ATPase [Candidatus Dormibacteraeota bacterium]